MDKFIKNLARGAGAILRDGFARKKKVTHKLGFWDPVTDTDLAAEQFIIEKIRRKYPSHGILSEEGGFIVKRKNFWVIDPLDGTRGFARGIPQFVTGIAFVSGGIVQHGAVYDPVHDELFTAQHRKGAYLNGKRMAVSETQELQHAFMGIYLGVSTDMKERLEIYRRYIKHNMWQIKTAGGLLTFAYCAAGRIDGIVCKGPGGPWDLAAAGLILKEAGARVTDFKGKPYRWNSMELVAANPVLHKKIMNAFELKKL